MNELQLRTTEMFGEVQTDIYENEYHEMFMTARQLGECLGYSEPTIAINKLISRNPYIKDKKFSSIYKIEAMNGKSQQVRLFNKLGICEIISLSNSNISKNKKRELINKICPSYQYIHSRKEIEFEEKLKEFLQPFRLAGYTQYQLDGYRIDFYIPALNIAIEYDENYHKYYNKEKELQREDYIISKLNCRIIRIDDNKSDEYNLGVIAKQVLNQINNCKCVNRLLNVEE